MDKGKERRAWWTEKGEEGVEKSVLVDVDLLEISLANTFEIVKGVSEMPMGSVINTVIDGDTWITPSYQWIVWGHHLFVLHEFVSGMW